ncbi:MAG: UDP-N-acetylmuramoyl-tripeptide--D-alanyl-D-alanine ligase [Vicinamibacterales bacterium]
MATVALTAAALAAAMGGRLTSGDQARKPTGYSIDSRTLAAGDLFFAIVAARDGHEFVDHAIAKGAAGVVVSRPASLVSRASRGLVIEVADTTRALQDLARHVRRESGTKVVAITGSAGKTTTKDVIAELLSERYQVVKNQGNLNNHLGLPLSLLELRHGADVAVMELGMNHAGEIRLLVDVAMPDVRVWTNVGEAHIGHFGTRERIADAKAEILEDATSEDLLVANADDPLVMQRSRHFPGLRITFGESPVADVRATEIEDLGLDGTRARVGTRLQSIPVHIPLVGRGQLSNVLCAAAVALEMGVSLSSIARRVESLKPSPRRGSVLRLANRITVLDDSYNSSPAALKSSLQALASITAPRRVAVLGEMLELGDQTIRLHQECGRAVAEAKVGLLITVGGDAARALGEAAVEAGMRPATVSHFAISDEAAAVAALYVNPGDVVLVKGSRGTRTDRVVDFLRAAYR